MKKTVLVAIGGVLVLSLAGFGAFYFKKHQEVNTKNSELRQANEKLTKELNAYKADPNEAAKVEVRRYVEEVGKLYALPKDEEPTAATVRDKEKLKDQPFFAKAENGDVTLIYTNAKLAILYRPSTKQLINVSSVTIQDQPTATPAP